MKNSWTNFKATKHFWPNYLTRVGVIHLFYHTSQFFLLQASLFFCNRIFSFCSDCNVKAVSKKYFFASSSRKKTFCCKYIYLWCLCYMLMMLINWGRPISSFFITAFTPIHPYKYKVQHSFKNLILPKSFPAYNKTTFNTRSKNDLMLLLETF